METITKTYKIFTYDELDKKIQNSLFDSWFSSNFASFNKASRIKLAKNPSKLIEYTLDQLKQGSYFENGKFFKDSNEN